MKNYYYTVIKQRPLNASSEGDEVPVGEIAFWTESESFTDTKFIFDAAEFLGIGHRGPTFLTNFSEINKLPVFPDTLSEDRPDWSDAGHKLWVIRTFVP